MRDPVAIFARWLLHQSALYDGTLPAYARSEMADLSQVARPVISDALDMLADRNAIRFRGGRIQVLNERELTAIAAVDNEPAPDTAPDHGGKKPRKREIADFLLAQCDAEGHVNYSSDEIADELGIPLGTVNGLIARFKKSGIVRRERGVSGLWVVDRRRLDEMGG